MDPVFYLQGLQMLILWLNGTCYGLTMRGSLYFVNRKVTLLFEHTDISLAFGPLILRNVDLYA